VCAVHLDSPPRDGNAFVADLFRHRATCIPPTGIMVHNTAIIHRLIGVTAPIRITQLDAIFHHLKSIPGTSLSLCVCVCVMHLSLPFRFVSAYLQFCSSACSFRVLDLW
jgi:hypothetical protein